MGEVRDLFNRKADVPAEVEAAAAKRRELQKVLDSITSESVLQMREPAISTGISIERNTRMEEVDKKISIPTNLAHVDLKRITDPADAVKPLLFATIIDSLAQRGVVLSETQLRALNNYLHLQNSGILDRRATGLGTSSAREQAQTADLRTAVLDKKHSLLAAHLGAPVIKLVDSLHGEIKTTWTESHNEVARKKQVEGSDALATELGTSLTGSKFLDTASMIEHMMAPLTQAGVLDMNAKRAKNALASNHADLAKASPHPVALSKLAADPENRDLAIAAQTERERDVLLAQAGAQASMEYIKAFIHDAATKLPATLE